MPLATFAEFGGTEEAYEKYLFLNADRESVALYHEFVRSRGVGFLVSGCAGCLDNSRGFAGRGGRSGFSLCGESLGGDCGAGDNRVESGCGSGDASGRKVESEVCDEGEDVSDDGLVRDAGCGLVGEGGQVRGKNWKKNRRKKANRKDRVVSDAILGSDVCVAGGEAFFSKPKDALRLSLEKKWALENELKAAKAARELELLKAEDLDAVKKLRERKVQGATERTMVQIEKAHASLVQTGNVPGVQPVQQGFCHTVVDGEIVESVPGLSSGESKGCSISPSSSISEREVRQMKKELEDLRARCEKVEKEKAKLRERLVAVAGLSTQRETAFSLYDGTLPGTVKDALEEVHGMENVERSYPGPHDPDTVYLKLEYPPVPGEYNDYY